ncbi:DUF3072 domain-containing protein [Pseudaestuariivita sp.]|uniref:DUF3072 domain-containing protein n=1 Tax=Pseudaestuariivita sp. TaxID=2211669 RepID=UPI0040598B55
MSKSTDDAALLRQRAGTPMNPTDPDAPLTEQTAAELRELALEKGEPFDGSLTELQAQERIKALKEM